jgi:DNA repair protein RecN (Recombination protein N)
MLRLLRIRNLAVIEAVDVELDAGFNALTGETGAGKSILVEAVGLLLGARASADLVRTGESHAAIEAIFEDQAGGEVLVRREVTSQGRSRSFVNGALATSGALRELAAGLVELHGQHETQVLLDPQSHLPILDTWAGLDPLVAQVGERHGAMCLVREQHERTRMDAREKAARLDLIAFQLGEIERAGLVAGEDEDLAATRVILANADRVQGLCAEGYGTLYERDDAVLSGLAQVWKRVGELAEIDPRFAAHVELRDGIKSQLEDLAALLRECGDGIDASPARLQQVEERLALLERLKRKYGPTLQDVMEKATACGLERDLLLRAGQDASGLETALAEARRDYLALARGLSQKRRVAAGAFTSRLESLLAELALASTRVEVRFSGDSATEDPMGPRGLDQGEFFVSPNPGEELRPLARIVSGGELSRIMLALKTMTARAGTGQTLIFDEVDAGIGGAVAEVVGERLRQLGEHFQVICITHLPQIAARASAQYHIDKTVRGSRTLTTVQRLDDPGRIEEIGRMIGGTSLSESVRQSAREMLTGAPRGVGRKGNRRRKAKAKVAEVQCRRDT